MPTSIILFSHGSVLCGAGESLSAMARELEQLADCGVGVGYLNYSAPLFGGAVDAAVADGANEIIVIPYFLVAGYFVKQQLPPLIELARQRYPYVTFHVAEALRAHPLLPQIVLACAARAQTIDEWRKWWKVAPEFCRNDPACLLYHSALCGTGTSALKEQSLPAPHYREEPVEHTALLVMVHGSPREESNLDMYTVVEAVRATQTYFYVQVGFLECNEPLITQAIANCVAAGAQRVVAVPYFLHAGRHVADDLPGLLEDAARQYPQVEFLMGEYLGQEPLLATVLWELAESAAAPQMLETLKTDKLP